MSNCIEKLSNIHLAAYTAPASKKDAANRNAAAPGGLSGTNILEKFLANQGIIAASSISAAKNAPVYIYKNDLRQKFQNNEAVIMGVIIRSLGAKDNTGNQLIREGDERGNLVNAVKRLDELKNLGINTLHLLPLHPPGKENALGTAGSVYAPAKLVEDNGDLAIDPEIIDENPPENARKIIGKYYKELTGRDIPKHGKLDKNDQNIRSAEVMYFAEECHKRGISIMHDQPSCVSYDFFKAHPEMMAFEKDGTPKTPAGWVDIRKLSVWKDETKRELNPHVVKMLKDYVDGCHKLHIDGIRADVAREKPTELWDMLISYSRAKDPGFAWLAESYTYEDASPQINIEKDRPQDALNAGFDSIYGQWHIYHEMPDAQSVINYIIENIEMSHKLEPGKSLIGSFGTHDDISIMNHGGVTYANHISGLQAALPMLNPYYFDGYQSGDYYMYDFYGKTDKETATDSDECTVHKSKPDIFNLSRPLIGKHPEIGDFMKNTLEVRNNPKYHKILTKGSFIPLTVDGDKHNQIIAFARHWNGRTLIFAANKDVDSPQSASIQIPGLKSTQKLENLYKSYGENSVVQAHTDRLNVQLGRGRVHLFEVDTPNIEKTELKVYRQKV